MIFSVVIPTFNRAQVLKRALDSVLQQTLQDFEIVVVDDGSTDSTDQLLKGYQDPRLKVFRQPNSGLPSKARNRGIGEARGEWTAFLDSDDYWLPDKLKKVEAALRTAPTNTIAVSHWEEEHRNGAKTKTLRHGTPIPSEFLYERLLLLGNCFSTSAMVVRTRDLQAMGGFDTRAEFRIVEDYELWLRIARTRHPVVSLEEVLGVYSIQDDSISRDVEKLNQNLYEVLRFHIDQNISSATLRTLLHREAKARTLYFASREYYRMGQYRTSFDSDLEALKAFPFGFKKWAQLFLATSGVLKGSRPPSQPKEK